MRAILAAAILLLNPSWAAPEPSSSTPVADSLDSGGGTSLASVVGVASSEAKDGHNAISSLAAKTGVQNPTPTTSQTPAAAAALATKSGAKSKSLPSRKEARNAPQVPLNDLCNAVLTSAEDNDLPVAFFANLIWQESGLRDNIVSSKGALGIAQFMPEVALEFGLANPFDPLQALPASARLLRELRDQFGNVGFAAAAYNAGAGRVNEWLNRGRTLPRETRDYVLNITGRSVEQWQKAPPDDAALQFTHALPCRDFPVFAELEQTQLQQAALEHVQVQQAQAEQPQKPKLEEKVAMAAPPKPARVAETKHTHAPPRHEQERVAAARHTHLPARHAELRVAELRHAPHVEEARFTAHERLRGRHEAKDRIHHAPEEQRRRA